MALFPLVLAALGTLEAVTGAVVFIEFIKEEAIQNVMMAASQAVRFNQKTKAKELYHKVRDVYALELAKTVGKTTDFDSDLVTWAGWQPWGVWDGPIIYPPPFNIIKAIEDPNGWGSLAPYANPAFIAYVNSTLLACKTNLDLL